MKKDVKDYLPQHHLDNFYIDEMLELTEEEIKPILLDLITWLKDMSKPIANQLLPVLIKNPNALEDIIKEILDGEKTDTIWKYNIITYVIKEFPLENKQNLKKTLERIVNKPYKYETIYETDIAAKAILNEIESK